MTSPARISTVNHKQASLTLIAAAMIFAISCDTTRTAQAGAATASPEDKDAKNTTCTQPVITEGNEYAGLLPSMVLGSGVNSLAGTVVDRCIDMNEEHTGSNNSDNTSPTGGGRQFQMTFVQEATQLKQALGVQAGGSFSAGLYKAEASARFFNEQSLDSSSAYLVLDVVVSFPPKSLANANLNEAALRKLSDDPEGFLAQCGDQFVSSITKGGIYRAIYRFSGLSTHSKRDLNASIKARGGNWSADANFRQSLEQATTRFQTELFVLQKGGMMKNVALTPAQLIAEASQFGAMPAVEGTQPLLSYATASPISVSTRPYYAASNFPPRTRYPNTVEQYRVMTELAPTYDKVRQLHADITDRLSRPGRLDDIGCQADKQSLTSKLDELTSFLRLAEKKVSACRTAPLCGASSECTTQIGDVKLEMPRLTNIKCGPRCTDGVGSSYDFDQYGYCTRCNWTEQSKTTVDNNAGAVFSEDCRYMRRGANILVRIQGKATTRVFKSGSWLEFFAMAKSAPEQSTCEGLYLPCRKRSVNEPVGHSGSPLSFDLRNHVIVGSSVRDESVNAYLDEPVCQTGDGNDRDNLGCVFTNVTIDVCDTDAVDCGVGPQGVGPQ